MFAKPNRQAKRVRQLRLGVLLLAAPLAAQEYPTPPEREPALIESVVGSSTVPTAEQLSAPGAFQAYLDRQFEVADRVGPIWLPSGDIRFAEPIRIVRRAGVTLAGVGAVPVRVGESSGWNKASAPRVRLGTRLVYAGPGDRPAIELAGTSHVCMRDLSIEPLAGGVGVLVHPAGKWGSVRNHMTNVVFLGGSVGVECGITKNDLTASDINFLGCDFRQCQTGFKVNHYQGLEYQLYGCDFKGCDTAIWLRRGGGITVVGAGLVTGPITPGVTQRFLRIGSSEDAGRRPEGGGGNTMPCNIYGVRIDRTGVADKQFADFILVDAVHAGTVVVGMDGVTFEVRGRAAKPVYAELVRISEKTYRTHRQSVRLGTHNFSAALERLKLVDPATRQPVTGLDAIVSPGLYHPERPNALVGVLLGGDPNRRVVGPAPRR